MTQINRQIPSEQPTGAISEPDALSSGAFKEAVTTTSDNPTLNSLQDTMHELLSKLEASIAPIMDYMSAETTRTKPVREMMSKMISDSQSDLAFAGEVHSSDRGTTSGRAGAGSGLVEGSVEAVQGGRGPNIWIDREGVCCYRQGD